MDWTGLGLRSIRSQGLFPFREVLLINSKCAGVTGISIALLCQASLPEGIADTTIGCRGAEVGELNAETLGSFPVSRGGRS